MPADMAAMSAMPAASAAYSAPGSSHGNGSNGAGTGYAWDNDLPSPSSGHDENQTQKRRNAPINNNNDIANGNASRPPLVTQNGNSTTSLSGTARKDIGTTDPFAGSDMMGAGMFDRPIKPAAVLRDTGNGNSPADSLPELYSAVSNGSKGPSAKRSNADLGPVGAGVGGPEDEASKWIHRDKLLRIESEELQAAGIILPAPRARSRPRQNTAASNATRRTAETEGGRSRKNSEAVGGELKTQDLAIPSWDLRTPEEINETNYWTAKGNSRIPVAKASPLPIPDDYLERDTPAARKRDSSPDEGGSIRMPKTRPRSSSSGTKLFAPNASSATAPTGSLTQPKRAVTDSSPTKKNPQGARKTSGPGKANGAPNRQKTRGAPSKDSTGSSSGGAATTRPSTRSGERELSMSGRSPPEGDPPWISAFKPDPRLPPDQQLLPTVARRLQQEKWEREGKAGAVYDREFRPLSEDGFLAPPEPRNPGASDEEKQPTSPLSPAHLQEEWPLKTEPPRSPISPGLRAQRTGSYSTIPKVQDPPISPIPGSRGNIAPGLPSPLVPVRVPDLPAEEPTKKGCMCCIVM